MLALTSTGIFADKVGSKSTGSDLTLDAAGDIILDADGADFRYKDAGIEFLRINNGATGAVLLSPVSNKDIIFKGNDDGSEFVALTLDMSEAGAATFNSDVDVSSGALKVGGTTVIDSSRNGSFADLEFTGSLTHPWTNSDVISIGVAQRGGNIFNTGQNLLQVMGADAYIGGQAMAGGDLLLRGGFAVDNAGLSVYPGDVTIRGGVPHSGIDGNGGKIYFQTGGTSENRLTIRGDGNVGIGESSPSQPLVVKRATDGAVIVANTAQAGGQGIGFFTDTANSRVGVFNNSSTSLDMVFNTGGTATSGEAMRIDNATGIVGIRTSSIAGVADSTGVQALQLGGTHLIHYDEDAAGTSSFSNNVYWNGSQNTTVFSGKASQIYMASGNIIFRNSDDNHGVGAQVANFHERLRINSEGNVGIGIQNPPKALTVFRSNQTDDTTVALLKLHAQFADSSIEENDKVAIQFAVQNNGGGIQTSDAIKFSYNNNLYLMEDGGDVAIGSVSNPSARLDISAPSNTTFGAQALKVRDGSYTTIQIDSGAADGRIQVGTAGQLRGVYKAQHAGTQTDHPFSLIQDNSSRLTIRDDRTVAHIDSGYRFDLGFFPGPTNTYQHFKTDIEKANHMVFFEYKGYSYSSGGSVLTTMTVYAYTGTSAPYDPIYTRYGHNTANGFVNCYYSSDNYLVLVLKTGHTAGYTGGWMWAQSGHNFADSNIRMLAHTSTSSNSGAY
jgi:hypothetical protein